MTEATEDDIAAVIVAAQTSNSNICAAALQQKFVITRRTHQSAAPGKLSNDQIMQIIRHVTSGDLREMLTCKRWKDGIDIDQPTFAADNCRNLRPAGEQWKGNRGPEDLKKPDQSIPNAVWAAKSASIYVLMEEIKRRKAAVEALKAFVSYEPWMDRHADDVQVSTFKRHTFGDLRRAVAIIDSQPAPRWECAAMKQGTAGGNDPADCNWPVCGCDPQAENVLQSLTEMGVIPDPVGTGSTT